MANNLETQTAVEPLTEYCRTCGHSKDSHNLDFKGAPDQRLTNSTVMANTYAIT